FEGNITVVVFDVSDRRQPVILAVNTTSYKPAGGGGAAQIGTNLFAFAGVQDSSGNNVLLIVDTTNPLAPAFQTVSIGHPITNMQAVGTVLYATIGSGGLAAYSVPGVSSTPPSVCPVSIDMAFVVDRGASVGGQSFLDAKAALKFFLNSLHTSSDQA